MNHKLHIVFLDFDDIKNPLLNGGQAKTTFEIGKEFIHQGHTVTVYSSKYPGYIDRVEEGIRYIHIGLYTENIKINNLLYIISLPFIVPKINADIIVECFTAPISTMLSPLFTRIPVVGLGTSFEAERFSQLYKLPFWIIEKFGCRLYRYFIAYNPQHEQKIKHFNKSIISTTIPEGVEKTFLQIQKGITKHILFIGRFDMHQKGIDLLIKAYATVRHSMRYPLIIVGRGPDEERIRNMIDELKLKNQVILLGPHYGDDKIKLLESASFVVIPSRSESFSLFTLEAIASGLPVVLFDIPGLSWVSPKVGIRSKPFNIKDYAANMKKFANDDLLATYSRETKTFALNFTWEKVSMDFITFFEKVLQNNHG